MPNPPSQTNIWWNEPIGNQSPRGLYKGLNATKLPSIPSTGPSSPFRAVRKPTWAYNEFFWMIFAPRATPQYDDEIFGSLAISAIENIQIENEWTLKAETTRKWTALERLIAGFDIAIQRACGSSGYLLPIGTKIPSYPSTHGYNVRHSTEAAAKHAAHNSLMSFTIMLTYLSYIVCMMQLADARRARLPGVQISFQNRFRASASNLNEAAVETFLTTWVWNLHLPRQGGFIDVNLLVNPRATRTWVKDIRYLFALKEHLPLWLYYGMTVSSASLIASWEPVLQTFYPTEVEWQNKSLANRDTQFSANQPSFSRQVTPESSRSIPITTSQSEKYNSTMSKQTIQLNTWFARRTMEREARLQNESEIMQNLRLQREEYNRTMPIPKRNEATVYEWVDNGEHMIRTVVGHRRLKEVWKKYTNTQRIYDSVFNEYDLWDQFDPNAYVVDSDEEDEDNEYGQSSHALHTVPSTTRGTSGECLLLSKIF